MIFNKKLLFLALTTISINTYAYQSPFDKIDEVMLERSIIEEERKKEDSYFANIFKKEDVNLNAYESEIQSRLTNESIFVNNYFSGNIDLNQLLSAILIVDEKNNLNGKDILREINRYNELVPASDLKYSEIISNFIPLTTFYNKWDHKISFNGRTIYQNHKLYNWNYISMENGIDNLKRTNINLSPITHDALPIRLCSINNNPNSPLFELSHHQFENFKYILSSFREMKELCLPASEIKDYFNFRANDFRGNFGHFISPPVTLHSLELKPYEIINNNNNFFFSDIDSY